MAKLFVVFVVLAVANLFIHFSKAAHSASTVHGLNKFHNSRVRNRWVLQRRVSRPCFGKWCRRWRYKQTKGFPRFPAKNFAFILTMDTPKDARIGNVRITGNYEVEYTLRTGRRLISIDKKTGVLKLLQKFNKAVAYKIRSILPLVIWAKRKFISKIATARVYIKILPLCFGNKFLRAIVNNGNVFKTNSISKTDSNSKNMPLMLLRGIRKFPRNDPARTMSMSQTKTEYVIKLAKRKIKQYKGKWFGRNVIVRFFLRTDKLFSKYLIDEIDKSCTEPNVVSSLVCRTLMNIVFRTIDGTCNNFFHPNLGASDTAFTRIRPALYFDAAGQNDPIGFPDLPNAPEVPSPFVISNDFIIDEVAAASSPTLSHAVMQFGQFLDHDLDLAGDSEGAERCNNVRCDGSQSDFEPPCFPIIPLSNGQPPCIRTVRSAAVCQKSGYPKTRQQINVNTAFVDASQIYGSRQAMSDRVRQSKSNDQGLLLSQQTRFGEFLPNDNDPIISQSACTQSGGCFLAGDLRVNEQQALTSFHTLFLREHNRIARKLKLINKHWNGETVFQETRKIMGAVLQKITYKDYLPLIIGHNAIKKYIGYNINEDPGISNAFATAAYRFGHSTIRTEFDLLNENFDRKFPAINLRFMFFNNTFIQEHGIEPLLLGLVGNVSEKVDRTLSPGITRHLFERNNTPGQNLAALNIHRSRDHGLPGYNAFRKFCRLGDAKTFEDTKGEIKDPENRKILSRLYNDDPNLAELWVAGLAEAPVGGGSVGPTFQCVIADQFRRTRDGDRFFYENKIGGRFSPDKVKEINKASLSGIYCDNLLNIVSIQRNAFLAASHRMRPIECNGIPRMNLDLWKDRKWKK